MTQYRTRKKRLRSTRHAALSTTFRSRKHAHGRAVSKSLPGYLGNLSASWKHQRKKQFGKTTKK